jgi:hypothetical protein
MFQRKSSFSLASLMTPALAFLAAGCGGIAATNQVNSSGTTLATTTSTSTSTLTATGTSTGTGSPYTFTVNGIGYTSETITVSTNHTLELTFAPGVQNAAIAGTGVYPEYSKMGVYVEVNGTTQQTAMLENGYYGTAQTSAVLDFSSAVPTLCGSGTTCRQNVTITITKPNNDYYCLNQGIYCPWNQVVQGQPWNGVVTVQTDDTTAITGG